MQRWIVLWKLCLEGVKQHNLDKGARNRAEIAIIVLTGAGSRGLDPKKIIYLFFMLEREPSLIARRKGDIG